MNVDSAPLASQFQRSGQCAGQLGDNTGKNNQRYAIADTARGNLLAKPHQKHRATNKRNHGAGAEKGARIHHHAFCTFQPYSNTVALHGC